MPVCTCLKDRPIRDPVALGIPATVLCTLRNAEDGPGSLESLTCGTGCQIMKDLRI